ncbi:PH domain-containing protein [Streptococcus iniae]|uniref:PH domain-containing protein n=1 Tax=Streptococcus iniae TaxID=1346 RepID=UPI002B307F9B|nr:PH domain-containing protein [Streptococcus iniae]WNZ89564.1 PH domain-containing protein [Streptococcus iniae]WNZ91192.1 PH domain-containing protein [Streptococcus iniae]
MADLGLLQWTFISETPIPNDIQEILVDGEKAIVAYKTIRDTAVFTDRRLIVKDVQGLTGKKSEIYSLPYSSINMWSTENAGTFDLNSEVELWTRAGHIKINLKRDINVRQFDHLIAQLLLK